MDPVLCEDVIRIEHALTKRNMHTHDIKAPLSGKQEAGGYNIFFEYFVKYNSFLFFIRFQLLVMMETAIQVNFYTNNNNPFLLYDRL